ncbi:predicted protein [Chaetomium globosum CBS 148.51]|uniref:Uncharacterized protein n=1 Tax=Chaetomium globosum (strain ATCC 6205 / CBS 148.51 / DSM 1962 / NBRC 6347 / NRRL 1970) TaxID=306901 RepID=Q2HBI1_CHAGB|nr:uncharacterized protein CHGG_02423 [Chaetomium globosum CBS 148.51]EAQ90488.1 predicted protein [Chaetomium globosum CBS 148.51]
MARHLGKLRRRTIPVGLRRGGKQRRTSRRLISTQAPKQRRVRIPVGFGATGWWETQEHCCGKRAKGKVSCIGRVALREGGGRDVRRDKPGQGALGLSVAPNGGSFSTVRSMCLKVLGEGVWLANLLAQPRSETVHRLSLLFQQGWHRQFHQGGVRLGASKEGDDASMRRHRRVHQQNNNPHDRRSREMPGVTGGEAACWGSISPVILMFDAVPQAGPGDDASEACVGAKKSTSYTSYNYVFLLVWALVQIAAEFAYWAGHGAGEKERALNRY